MKGEGIPQALECLYQSAHLNMAHNIQSNHGTQLLMQSSVYGRIGMVMLHDVWASRLTIARPQSPRRHLL